MKRSFFALCSLIAMITGRPLPNAMGQTINNSNSALTGQQYRARIRPVRTAFPFLRIAPDARSAGMGNVGVASTPSKNATHWNDAKLAFIPDDVGAGLHYTPWLTELVNDMNMGYANGYTRLNQRSTLGASFRYFSWGDLVIASGSGGRTRQTYNAKEYAFQLSYSRKLSDQWSAGIAAKYIRSDRAPTYQNELPAADISFFYRSDSLDLLKRKARFRFGISISDVGPKISYDNTSRDGFLPTELRLGPSFEFHTSRTYSLELNLDFRKLMVPTPPIRHPDRPEKIIAGRDPDRSVISGMFGSFTDAPGYPVRDANGSIVYRNDGSGKAKVEDGSPLKEELREVNIGVGMEHKFYQQFSARLGYFYEHPTKGGRQFVTTGFGIRYRWASLDLSYLIATDERDPLGNTLRIGLGVDF